MVIMRLVWWIVIFILAIVYLRFYFKSPKDVAILQTTLQNFSFEILREKQPLVIQDRIQNLQEIKKTWFKHIVAKDVTLNADELSTWYTNKYKYLILHPSSSCEVLLYPASEKLVDGVPPENATLVAIKLAEHQMVIIPYRMHYSISSSINVPGLGVHDYITMWLP